MEPVFVTLIVFVAIYKVFELFVRRRERMALIEKLGEISSEKVDLSILANGIGSGQDSTYATLRWGSLAAGVGLALLTASIMYLCIPGDAIWHVMAQLVGGLVLLCGGIGLLIAFVVERKLRRESGK